MNSLEKVIEKWELILQMDSSLDCVYSREVLEEMFFDFKQEIKLLENKELL
jgi:hypothetical protein